MVYFIFQEATLADHRDVPFGDCEISVLEKIENMVEVEERVYVLAKGSLGDAARKEVKRDRNSWHIAT